MEGLQKIVVLGTGHRSQVWLVRKDGLNFALKEVAKANLAEIEVRHLFNEKSAFLALSHPGIIKSLKTFQDSDFLYFLMQVAPGAPLSHLLTRGAHFSEPQVQYICYQIAEILVYMRSQGYIYRDLKLSNVFWDDKGTVTVVDLGFCKKIGEERTYTVCGTRHMMSPEIFRHLIEGGEPHGHGYECDYWALGIMAYELIRGKPPFGLVEDDIYERILRGLPSVDTSSLSDLCKSFISSLLVPDPFSRLGHTSPSELVSHPWLASSVIPVLPTSPQVEAMHDWCEFLSDEDEPAAEGEDPFSSF